mmetsp:Transcript_1721/g.2312  ORF Transcript_1721/g.2312 Transcript_1721/m.2312 type:complete len:83 (+) Transcript_1721:1-249(+)
MGQPALLYLVPCCLGCMCFLGWRRQELTGLWEGPKVIRTVDAILFGEYQPGYDQEEDTKQPGLSGEDTNDEQDVFVTGPNRA